jgi:hypothetical protein
MTFFQPICYGYTAIFIAFVSAIASCLQGFCLIEVTESLQASSPDNILRSLGFAVLIYSINITILGIATGMKDVLFYVCSENLTHDIKNLLLESILHK